MGVGVRKGSETVVVLLASRIPQGQLDVLAINLDIGDIVLENGGDVDLSACISKYRPKGNDIASPGLPQKPSTKWPMPRAALAAGTLYCSLLRLGDGRWVENRQQAGRRAGRGSTFDQFLPRGRFPWRKHCKCISKMIVGKGRRPLAMAARAEAVVRDTSERAVITIRGGGEELS